MFKSVRNILEQRIFHLYKFSKIHIILIYFIFAIDKIIVAFSLIFDQRTLSFLDNIHAGIKSRTNNKILRSWSAKQRSCTELPQKQRLSHSLWKDGKIDSSRQGLALRASAWAKSSIRVRYIRKYQRQGPKPSHFLQTTCDSRHRSIGCLSNRWHNASVHF